MSGICFCIGYADNQLNLAVLTATINQIHLIGMDEMIIYTDKQIYYDYLFDNYSEFEIKKVELTNLRNQIKFDKVNKIWSPDFISTLKIKVNLLFVKVELINWYQGIVPEESYLKHRSRIRFLVLCFLEYLSLLVTDKKIFVSKSMKEFYYKKYKIKNIKSYIVPCISDISYNGMDKIPNSYAYVGGMSEWQCIDKILDYYSKFIQDKDSKLFIITRDINIAEEKIQKYKIINYVLKVINDRKEMESFLSQMEYGFLFREKVAVNRVSSPIKFAEYLACGVKMIMTDAIPHYKDIIQKNSIGIIVSEDYHSFNKIEIDVNKIIDTYNKYFNIDIIKENYTNFIKK